MTKVVGMLVALAMFCAMPALAFAQNGDGGEASNNEQNANIDQDGTAGDGGEGGDAAGSGGSDDGSGSDGGDAQGGEGGDGGSVGNQAAICQQNAGDDANCSIDQSQTVGGDTFVDNNGDGVDDDNVVSGDVDDDDDVTFDNDVGGRSVESVTLARTGFDAWVLALVGGLALAGGLGLLAAQRRGKLNA